MKNAHKNNQNCIDRFQYEGNVRAELLKITCKSPGFRRTQC
jgi:hypothetical protein